jgi:hypothetical protein
MYELKTALNYQQILSSFKRYILFISIDVHLFMSRNGKIIWKTTATDKYAANNRIKSISLHFNFLF